jgi:predicted nucleic acid-binding protein
VIVVPDTNSLIAMLCFAPIKHGRKTLAAEVAEAEVAGECSLLVTQSVADELREVVRRAFPKSLPLLEPFLESYGIVALPASENLLAEARVACVDKDDAPILLSAVQCALLYGASLLLSNDIQNFHTPTMKTYLSISIVRLSNASRQVYRTE